MACNKKAAFAGAMIYTLFDSFADEQERMSPYAARLRTMLIKQLKLCDRGIARQADRAFERVLESIKDTPFKLSIATVIDTLYFNFENQMRSMYGNKIGDAVVRYTTRFAPDIDSKVATDSYRVADMLTLEFEKEAKNAGTSTNK